MRALHRQSLAKDVKSRPNVTIMLNSGYVAEKAMHVIELQRIFRDIATCTMHVHVPQNSNQ